MSGINGGLKRKNTSGNVNGSLKIFQRKFKEDTCPICMDSIINLVALDICFHEYCLSCICSWLSNNLFCPHCKQIPKYLLCQVINDQFFLSLPINNNFKYLSTQEKIITELFTIKLWQHSQLITIFMRFLKQVKYTVISLRKIFYFCGIKILFLKFSKQKGSTAELVINSNHQIWLWLNSELSLFFNGSFVKKFIKKSKSKITSLAEIKEELSLILSQPLLSRFLSEMNTFLSCYEWKNNNVNNLFIGGDNDCVNISLLATVLVDKVMKFEFDSFEIDGEDMMPLFEISHIYHLIKSISKVVVNSNGDEVISYLMDFIDLRLQQFVIDKRNTKQIHYKNYYKMSRDYRFIYWQFMRKQIDNASKKSNSEIVCDSSTSLDFSIFNQSKQSVDISIDLT